MSDGTVSGRFELSAEQALRTLSSIRDRGAEADVALDRLGKRMDSLATSSERAQGRLDRSWREISRSINVQADQIDQRVDRLGLKLRDLGSVTARPTVDLSGIERANLAIDALEVRLDKLRVTNATAHVRIAQSGGFGGGGGFGGAGVAGRGPGAFSSPGGIPGVLPWWALAAPLASPLLGGAVSLLGSATSAALGAGTVGLGAAGVLGAGAGLSFLGIKPAITEIAAIQKAQENAQKVTATYGASSAQAKTARLQLNAALVQNPGAAGAAGQLTQFRSTYNADLAGARSQAYRGVSGSLYNLTRAAPQVGAAAATATGATSSAAISFSRFLSQPEQLSTLQRFSHEFAMDLPVAERSLQNVVVIFEHLATAALPFFREGNVWIEQWTAGIARSSGDTQRVQSRMSGYVQSAKDWARLTGAAYRDIRDLFSAGTPAGNSMVVDLTHTLDKWDRSLINNPQKVDSFFSRAKTGTEEIASTLSHLVGDLGKFFGYIDPIVHRALQLLNLVSGMGPGSVGLLGALGYGAYEGVRGGRGPSGLSLASAFVTGGVGPRFMAGGGARAAGGVMVGGAAETAVLGRASILAPRGGPWALPSGVTRMGASTYAEQLALFGGAGVVGAAGRALPAIRGALATPEAFSAAYGGVEGARYAGPVSELGARAGVFAGARGVVGTALEGAAKFALPVVAIMSVLQAAQAKGNVAKKAEAGLGTAVNLLTLGFGKQAFGVDTAGASLSNPRTRASVDAIAKEASAVRTPGQLRALQEKVSFIPILGEMSPQDAGKLRAALRHASNVAASNAGATASNSWESAFSAALGRGEKVPKAAGQLISGIGADVKALGPRGARDMAKDIAQWVGEMQTEDPKLRKPLQKVMDSVISDIDHLHGHVTGKMGDIQTKVAYFNGQIYKNVDGTWQAIRDAMVNPASVAREKLLGIFGQIQAEAVDALVQMGFSQSDARSLVAAEAKGGVPGAKAGVTVGVRAATNAMVAGASGLSKLVGGKKHAHGGMIGGDGLLDTVEVPGGRAAPGEGYIANRHSMAKLSAATLAKYGLTAWQVIQGETKQHSAPFARGGQVTMSEVSSGLGGIPGLMDNVASAAYLDGFAQKMSAMGPASSGGPPGGRYSGSLAGWLSRALRITNHYSPANLSALEGRAMQESSGDPHSINLWDSNAKAGHPSKGLLQCVPLDTEILTRDGWKRHDEVLVGDETLGFNPATGRNEWTTITAVVHHEQAAVVRIGNRKWNVRVTPNHRWWSEPKQSRAEARGDLRCPECGIDWPTQKGLDTHRGKAHGKRAAREIFYGGRFVRSDDLRSTDRLRLAALADAGPGVELTQDEVRIIAWLQGDGHIRRAETEDEKWDGAIYQSKPKFVVALRALLADVPHTERMRHRNPDHLPAYQFTLLRSYVTGLLERVPEARDDPEAFVLSLSAEQRAAWLETMIDAEGHRQVTGESEFVRLAQADGSLQDAIVLAVYLEGYRPSRSPLTRRSTQHAPASLVGMCRPYVAPVMFREAEEVGEEPVWCVRTELETWTMRQDGKVMLTGNTIDSTFSQYALPGYGDIWNPVDNAIAAIRYMYAGYGHIVGPSSTGYALGGRVNWAGWNAQGGSFTTNGPTLFGAGEGGRREHVSITPLGGARGNRQIVVNMENVHLGTGDPATLEKVATEVAGRILDALERVDGTSDHELIGAGS